MEKLITKQNTEDDTAYRTPKKKKKKKKHKSDGRKNKWITERQLN